MSISAWHSLDISLPSLGKRARTARRTAVHTCKLGAYYCATKPVANERPRAKRKIGKQMLSFEKENSHKAPQNFRRRWAGVEARQIKNLCKSAEGLRFAAVV